MSALAIQPVQTASAAGGASSPTASAGGFDAVLAGLGSQDAPPTAAAAPAPPIAPDGGLLGVVEPLDETLSPDPDSEADDLAEILGATGPDIVAGSPIVFGQAPTPADTPPKIADYTATAWGRDKSAGLPAAPALANASSRAAFLRTEATPDASSTSIPDDVVAGPSTTVGPTEPPRAARPASASLPASPAAPAPSSAAAAPEAATDAAPSSDIQETVSSPVQAATPATPASPAAAAALAAPARAEPASRPGKSERARTTDGVDAAPAGEGRRPAEGPAGPRAVKAAQAAAPPGTEAPRVETALAANDAEDPTTAAPIDAAASDAAATAPSLTGATPVRGAPETVANLAAQILKKLDGRSTRFDVELDPAGLGKVDVRIEIGPQGRMTASMIFDNPQAAQDLKARSGELRQALEQAGFDLAGGLSFDVSRDGGGGRGQAWQDPEQGGQAFRGQAFRAALDSAAGAADSAVQGALRLRQGVNAGLDLRI